LDVRTGVAKTGVVGLLRGEVVTSDARTLAIRADMDALPIHEMNEIEYRSQVNGKMHACGHDGHTAILLAVAAVLSKRRQELKGNVTFLFQPAEETLGDAKGGAQRMVEEGIMEGVDGIIGLHLMSTHPVGRVGVRAGSVFASADEFLLTVKGRGGHAAMPEEAVDPIVIAAYMTTALQTLISRETSPFRPAVITIGAIKAGTAFNIIPETALMQGTMRAFTPEHRASLLRRIEELANGVATAMGGSCSIEVGPGCPPCINDKAIAALVRDVAIAAVGAAKVDEGEEVMTTGGDDMAYFLQETPGCYFIVGAGNQEKEASYPHHHPHFTIDEDALAVGVEVLSRAALDFLGE
ncbi:MAG: amidohydrolase, partial [Ktedonobacteraceae bacterium]|nr:amidohydrolase [Ktedonobacteraceae bacterium]